MEEIIRKCAAKHGNDQKRAGEDVSWQWARSDSEQKPWDIRRQSVNESIWSKSRFSQESCMDVIAGPSRRLSAEELMLLNCGAGEDSWESLGLQDQISQSRRKSTLNIHWKDRWWSWSSNTLATWSEEPIHWKRLWCWERLKAAGKGAAEGEIVGWHHRLNEHESEQTLGDREGQGSQAYCSSLGHKELDMT